MLNLPGITESTITEDAEQYTIYARIDTPPPPCCLLPPVKNGTKGAQYRDFNQHGKFVTIKLARQRYLCQTCKRTLYQPVPHMDDEHMMTQRLAAYLIKRSMDTTFKGLEREMDIEETTIRRMFRAFAKEQLGRVKIETPEYMGMDELHILSKFRGVITDVKNKTLVDLLPNRDQKTIVSYLSRLKDRERVKAVTIDMWHPYRRAINLVLPGVPIVVDKFHVVRMAYDAVERVRKEHRKDLTRPQRLRLKDDRWLLRKKAENLEAHDNMILETWLQDFPVLREVYEAKERFRAVWACQTRQDAQRTYDEWSSTLPARCEAAFWDLRAAMVNWREEIFNYFDLRITNSYTEAKNGLIRIINRAGRGYSFEVLRAKMLLDHRNYTVQPVAEKTEDNQPEGEAGDVKHIGKYTYHLVPVDDPPQITILPHGVPISELAKHWKLPEINQEVIRVKRR